MADRRARVGSSVTPRPAGPAGVTQPAAGRGVAPASRGSTRVCGGWAYSPVFPASRSARHSAAAATVFPTPVSVPVTNRITAVLDGPASSRGWAGGGEGGDGPVDVGVGVGGHDGGPQAGRALGDARGPDGGDQHAGVEEAGRDA